MTRQYLITVSLLAIFYLTMVVLGYAFFNGVISPEKQSIYDVGLNVMTFHIIALLAMTFMNRYLTRSYLDYIFYLFTFGTLIFAIPTFIIATEEATNIIISFFHDIPILGAIILFAGWVMVLFTGVTYQHKKRAIQNQ